MLPVKKPIREYRTLDEIRLRKDELLEQLQQDNTRFSTLWKQVFLKREENTKTEYITGLVSNGIIEKFPEAEIKRILEEVVTVGTDEVVP